MRQKKSFQEELNSNKLIKKEENISNSNDNEQFWRVIRKVLIIFSLLTAIGTLIAYVNGFEDPLGIGLLVGLSFLVMILAFFKLKEKLVWLKWSFSYLGGYIGAVIIPMSNLYINEPDPWAFLTASFDHIMVMIIMIVIGAFLGSLCHVILKQTSSKMGILGAITFDLYLIWLKQAGQTENIVLDYFFIYQMLIGLVIGACIAGTIEFVYKRIKDMISV